MDTDSRFARRMEAMRLLKEALACLDDDADNFACAYVATAIDRLEHSMKNVAAKLR